MNEHSRLARESCAPRIIRGFLHKRYAMNFVFISPNFPTAYERFCEGLHDNGVNVLGIGDASTTALATG